MVLKMPKCPKYVFQNLDKVYQNLKFWFENIPSGSPVAMYYFQEQFTQQVHPWEPS
jgi:hypothetical protein